MPRVAAFAAASTLVVLAGLVGVAACDLAGGKQFTCACPARYRWSYEDSEVLGDRALGREMAAEACSKGLKTPCVCDPCQDHTSDGNMFICDCYPKSSLVLEVRSAKDERTAESDAADECKALWTGGALCECTCTEKTDGAGGHTGGGGQAPACPIGDDYCYYCSGPSAGPVTLTVPGAQVDYAKAFVEIGWKSATELSNFELGASDAASGAHLDTGATNVGQSPLVLGENTNVRSLSVTRDAVSIMLERTTQDSAFGAGDFGVDGAPSESIRQATVTLTFSGKTANVEVTATGWQGGAAALSFTGVYQLSDACP